jgi:hypothetical protein
VSISRIFVGTLHSGEAEFDECCQMIADQEDVQASQTVISGKRELEAHNALWDAWNAAKDSFDLFVKVDADTVLVDTQALARIADLFAADADVTGAQILLHDYFTDGSIAGLNAFSPAVTFTPARSRLHSDRVDTNHKTVLRGPAVAALEPIGYHCRYPHAIQAFHFGVHRGLKRQHDVLHRVAEAWRQYQDDARGWALAGALTARSPFMRGGQDYQSRRLHRRFKRLLADTDERQRRVNRYVTELL